MIDKVEELMHRVKETEKSLESFDIWNELENVIDCQTQLKKDQSACITNINGIFRNLQIGTKEI